MSKFTHKHSQIVFYSNLKQ